MYGRNLSAFLDSRPSDDDVVALIKSVAAIWDRLSVPVPESKWQPVADEFDHSVNQYAGKTWREAIGVDTSPNYGNLNFAFSAGLEFVTYYLATEMVRVLILMCEEGSLADEVLSALSRFLLTLFRRPQSFEILTVEQLRVVQDWCDFVAPKVWDETAHEVRAIAAKLGTLGL